MITLIFIFICGPAILACAWLALMFLYIGFAKVVGFLTGQQDSVRAKVATELKAHGVNPPAWPTATELRRMNEIKKF